MRTKSPKTLWHRIFGQLLEGLLTPLNLDVYTDLPVMAFPPEADIVIIRRKEATWTSEQRKYLPDGIRDTDAHYIIIEFKYTESVNLIALKQASSYDLFFQMHKKVNPEDLQTFLVTSKTPNKAFMSRMEYKESGQNGIYQSDNIAFQSIKMMVLNQLPDEEHNVFLNALQAGKKKKLRHF
ncbi:MAG: hypothetical protein OMM_06071 [Candidatus Magnetoglobus multicellularis str. Araruama]|uniref:Rpn family recombination-promoting nuclease/putative transposase n=1 Tax=Candidatus Magnetoglobus multicellularis str. Araruama TaxID=890399 RepID=A0A1V1NS14_9BACT|nr:MAG: hypothetical protein OMM_06071 [Candidatus Magnetoglobus multicellularis str. Araruama]